MGEDPDRIRREIEATREEMGDTVDALSYKADVKSRARDSIVEKKESAKESLMGTKDSIKSRVVGTTDRVGEATGRVGDAAPDREQVKQKGRQVVGIAQENPLGLAIGSVAAGFIVGMLVPSSRVEDQKLGPIADDVKEKVKDTGQEALQRGQQVAQEAAQSAQQTVQERGREESQELASSAQQNAQEAASSAR